MAGIGFTLQNMLKGDTYGAAVKAHFYSVLICAGPWLMSILTLFCLSVFSPSNIDQFELDYFRNIIVYIFAFSLIATGPFQLTVTRHLADKIYLKEGEALIPAFLATCAVVLVIQTTTAFAFMMLTPADFALKVLVTMVYSTVSLLWLIMLFLTALKDYKPIAIAYLIGSVLAIVLSVWLGSIYQIHGYFMGYLVGHLFIVVMLTGRIFIEMESTRTFDGEVFSFVIQNKTLLLIGLIYNLAIWIDKFVFWFSPNTMRETSKLLFATPLYDSAVFIAYLTIIPALSIFMIHIETDFYVHYKNFYAGIIEKNTYSAMRNVKAKMTKSLRASVASLIKYQGLISLVTITFAPEIAGVLNLQPIQIPIFRIAVAGAFLHSLFLITMIVILYYDFKRLALLVVTCFFITNGLFTAFTTGLELIFWGYGYLAAAGVSLMFAFYALDFKLKRLEYITFALQPIGHHRDEEVM